MKKIILLILLVSNIYADFVRDGEQIVRDNDTGLMWSDHYIETLSWIDSINYCENLTRNGSADWRLPNIQELLSIVGGREVLNSSYPNSLNNIFELGSISDSYWASTSNNNSPSYAYNISARYGKVSYIPKTAENQVRCVRNF